MSIDKLKEKWHKGQVREYDPIFNRGCCYCVNKVWKPCRFSHKIRMSDDCMKRREVNNETN